MTATTRAGGAEILISSRSRPRLALNFFGRLGPHATTK
jgi:hypothetical protein